MLDPSIASRTLSFAVLAPFPRIFITFVDIFFWEVIKFNYHVKKKVESLHVNVFKKSKECQESLKIPNNP